MTEEFNDNKEAEKLKAENDFLKMKIMLEHGADFGGDNSQELPASVENEFLRNVIAFEQQFQEHKTIKVFDKLGRPTHFRPANLVPDDEIDHAWDELRDFLNEKNIDLDACSPNISHRELYRFTLEELFEHEMDDMDLPGWTTNFIYDEFHPDPIYDNSRIVKDDIISDIFRTEPLFYMIHYDRENISINDKVFADREALEAAINVFKSVYDEINLNDCQVDACIVNENDCIVSGTYEAKASTGNQDQVFKGDFKTRLVLNDLEYWCIKELKINGFNL